MALNPKVAVFQASPTHSSSMLGACFVVLTIGTGT